MGVIYKVDLTESCDIEIDPDGSGDEAYLHVTEYSEEGFVRNHHTNINIPMNIYAIDRLIKALNLARLDVINLDKDFKKKALKEFPNIKFND